MNTRLLLILLPIIFIFSGCNKPEKKSQSPVVTKEINEFPYLTFTNLDGSPATTRDLPGASVLILFNADCDHCQREAQAIQEKLESFKKYTLQFIASDAPEVIQKFAQDYKLTNQPNISLAERRAWMYTRTLVRYPHLPFIFILMKKVCEIISGRDAR
ncbi:MAG: redoxin domain-containing protein [Flammeovirgaceae bacterium]|nr:redoxin domain-containing protein [Flammeovirgaceae bacterium]